MTAKNKKHSQTKKKFKLEKPMIIISIIILALILISYFLFGIELTIILTIGILLILGIARLLDKIKSKPKRKKQHV